MNTRSFQEYFLLVLIVGALWFSGAIFKPFLVPLALAAAFAVVLHPLYLRLLKDAPKYPSLVALFTLSISIVCIVLPIVIIGTLLGREAARVYGSFTDGSATIQVSAIVSQLQSMLPTQIPGVANLTQNLAGNVNEYGTAILTWVTSHIGDAFSSIASSFLSFFVFLVALFFFMRDGAAFRKTLIELSPLPDKDDEMIFDHLATAVNSVIRGNLLIALIRGVLATIGFAIFGIPNSILWGTMTGLAGLIPGIGLVIVFAPAILYAFFTSGAVPAIGLLCWGFLVVGLADNILGPKIVGHGTQLHPLFVLLAILGGIDFFGPIGIFLGPIVVSFLIALLSIYSTSSKKRAA